MASSRIFGWGTDSDTKNNLPTIFLVSFLFYLCSIFGSRILPLQSAQEANGALSPALRDFPTFLKGQIQKCTLQSKGQYNNMNIK